MRNALNWFELPTTDIERAAKFYGQIFDAELQIDEMYPGFKMAVLPYEPQQGGVGGAIVQGEGYAPSTTGVTLYLNGGDDLSVVLDRVEAAGGKKMTDKTDIGENGFMAFFMDTEGNKVGLHSPH